jgi:hypothetical protein
MNRKTTYLIPAFVAVFALMFTVATPLAMAEASEGMFDNKMDQKHKKMHKVIEVDGFVGSIQITEDADRQALKNQITVSLSEAASGLDVVGGHIGAAINEGGDKYLVWTLKSIEKDSESGIVTVTIHVIDAADVTNTTTVTREVDQSERDEKRIDKISNKIDRLEEKISESSGDADIDAARDTFVEKLQELRQAIQDGDSERISELRDELKDLRSELGNMRTNRQ